MNVLIFNALEETHDTLSDTLQSYGIDAIFYPQDRTDWDIDVDGVLIFLPRNYGDGHGIIKAHAPQIDLSGIPVDYEFRLPSAEVVKDYVLNNFGARESVARLETDGPEYYLPPQPEVHTSHYGIDTQLA